MVALREGCNTGTGRSIPREAGPMQFIAVWYSPSMFLQPCIPSELDRAEGRALDDRHLQVSCG